MSLDLRCKKGISVRTNTRDDQYSNRKLAARNGQSTVWLYLIFAVSLGPDRSSGGKHLPDNITEVDGCRPSTANFLLRTSYFVSSCPPEVNESTHTIHIHIWGRLFRLNLALARKLPEDGIAVPTVPINKESLFTYAATRRESEEYIGSTYMSIN